MNGVCNTVMQHMTSVHEAFSASLRTPLAICVSELFRMRPNRFKLFRANVGYCIDDTGALVTSWGRTSDVRKDIGTVLTHMRQLTGHHVCCTFVNDDGNAVLLEEARFIRHCDEDTENVKVYTYIGRNRIDHRVAVLHGKLTVSSSYGEWRDYEDVRSRYVGYYAAIVEHFKLKGDES